MKKVQADQRLPYKLMKNKFLYREKYKKLLNIVNKNIQNINPEEVIQIFKKLSDTGCSCAMLANTLVEQIYTDDLTFYNTFKFSILENDAVDCNKLMVDIFSKLYGVMKIRFIEYKRYSFANMKEASLELLGKNYNDDSQASLDLFNNGFSHFFAIILISIIVSVISTAFNYFIYQRTTSFITYFIVSITPLFDAYTPEPYPVPAISSPEWKLPSPNI